MMKSRFSGFLFRSQGAAISEAELIHLFQAQRFGAIGAGPAASLGAGPFVVEKAIIKKGKHYDR